MIEYRLIEHEGKKRIAIYFPFDKQIYEEVKKLHGSRWSHSQRFWHVPDTLSYRKQFGLPLYFDKSEDADKNKKMEEFIRWLKSKRYSESTIKTYTETIVVFLNFFSDKKVESIENEDIIRFNNEYILKNRFSASYQNQFVNAIKLFYKTIENKRLDADLIHRPRKELRLPRVLSKEEIKSILESPVNLKHRMMLCLIYACGLRRSEVINLKPSDILSHRNLLHVYQSKGKKDRIVPISDKIIELLRDYYKAYRPKYWLFEGQTPGTQYSPTSLQEVLRNAVKKSGIKKPVTLHWLRHSYATHLLENGTDIRYIQELLGHNSSRTTEIYTHVSKRDIQKIKSPFDDL